MMKEVIAIAEVKDKVITVESLKALHDYNAEIYETKENILGLVENIETSLEEKFDKPTNNIIPIKNGGTGASNGEDGLENLFASGITVLSSYQYGDKLPTAGVRGRIFFKRLTNVQE